MALFLLGGGVNLYGRGLWYPLLLQVWGTRTLEETIQGLKAKGVKQSDLKGVGKVLILGIKKDRRLEVWALSEGKASRLLLSYPFTGFSGKLGPKLREGDHQIPEGIYRIVYLNPNSSYHLSMKVNYPNKFDLSKAGAEGRNRPGSDIFIHGKNVTIGCIPIGDRAIEELFLLVHTVGQKNVEVVITPVDFRDPKAVAPQIPSIDWEGELYAAIRNNLSRYFPKQ